MQILEFVESDYIYIKIEASIRDSNLDKIRIFNEINNEIELSLKI